MSVQIITAVEEAWIAHEPAVFLAGGITGCPDWQADMIKLLADEDELTLLNPRRPFFDVRDPDASPAQIRWEAKLLQAADVISFWFPYETLCPITLYELGAWSAWSDEFGRPKPILVGIHPAYARRIDVEIQTGLRRPEVEIVYSLEALAEQISALP